MHIQHGSHGEGPSGRPSKVSSLIHAALAGDNPCWLLAMD